MNDKPRQTKSLRPPGPAVRAARQWPSGARLHLDAEQAIRALGRFKAGAATSWKLSCAFHEEQEQNCEVKEVK